jgi:hypothetical protein
MSLKIKINKYRLAHKEFINAETALDCYVGPEISKRNTVDDLMELLDILPLEYRGRRRIYQKIHEISTPMK